MNRSAYPTIQKPYAFFFDIDGTLAGLQSTPDAVSIPTEVIAQLVSLSHSQKGALAVVSGRPLTQIDKLIAPLVCAAAGIHGAEVRDAQGIYHQVDVDPQQLKEIATQLTDATEKLPGVLLEKKALAFALHFRQAPEFEQTLHQLASEIVRDYPTFTLQPGKCVWEIKPQQCDKGAAIDFLMKNEPFQGRTPIFVGDDVTDESGFRVVNQRHGISIKIGTGVTEARYRLAGVTQLYQWLQNIMELKSSDVEATLTRSV